MKFDRFLQSIDHVKAADLPGNPAHDAILPIMAEERKRAWESDPDPRLSGVAATLYPRKGEAYILLIERQAYEGVHSAQVGFPGGKMEDFDEDLNATARREMEEEVGIDRHAPTFVKSLSKVYIPPSRFLVQPFLYYLESVPDLRADEREVKSIIEMPMEQLLDDRTVVEGKVKMSNGVSIRTPYFEYDGYQIWGATAMMLSELKTLLKHTL